MATGRQIGPVVLHIMELIPEEEENKAFRAQLSKFTDSLCYYAPETMGKAWLNLGDLINQFIVYEQFSAPWEERVARVFTGDMSVEESKKTPVIFRNVNPITSDLAQFEYVLLQPSKFEQGVGPSDGTKVITAEFWPWRWKRADEEAFSCTQFYLTLKDPKLTFQHLKVCRKMEVEGSGVETEVLSLFDRDTYPVHTWFQGQHVQALLKDQTSLLAFNLCNLELDITPPTKDEGHETGEATHPLLWSNILAMANEFFVEVTLTLATTADEDEGGGMGDDTVPCMYGEQGAFKFEGLRRYPEPPHPYLDILELRDLFAKTQHVFLQPNAVAVEAKVSPLEGDDNSKVNVMYDLSAPRFTTDLAAKLRQLHYVFIFCRDTSSDITETIVGSEVHFTVGEKTFNENVTVMSTVTPFAHGRIASTQPVCMIDARSRTRGGCSYINADPCNVSFTIPATAKEDVVVVAVYYGVLMTDGGFTTFFELICN